MIPMLVWHEHENYEVHTLDALDRLIDQLDRDGRETTPFAVSLQVNPQSELCIVVGCEESHVEFYAADQSPLVVGCTDPWDDDLLIAHSYRGHYSEMPRRYCVPIADAREAMRLYFQTGKRPENQRWNEW